MLRRSGRPHHTPPPLQQNQRQPQREQHAHDDQGDEPHLSGRAGIIVLRAIHGRTRSRAARPTSVTPTGSSEVKDTQPINEGSLGDEVVTLQNTFPKWVFVLVILHVDL